MSSDAKAKAEARRAKILARDSKRTVSAVSGDDEDALYANLGEVKGKERPIASRRNFIRSASQLDSEAIAESSEPTTPLEKGASKSDLDVGDNSQLNESTVTVSDEKGDVSKSDEQQATPSKEAAVETTNVGSSSSIGGSETNVVEPISPSPAISPMGSSVRLPPPKTLAEIEREVAENTAKFDRTMSFRSNSTKANPERLAQLEQLARKKNTHHIDPSNMMRLIRLLVIGLLAAYTGYRTAEVSRLEVVKANALELQTIKEYDAIGNVLSETPVASGASPVKNTVQRTWIGYFQDQYTRRSECTITAVMLAWWIAGIFKRFVNTSVKQQKEKSNIIEQVYNYINGFQEAALGTLGEFGWHLFVLIFTVTCHSMYYSHLAMTQGGVTSSGSGVCANGGDTSCITSPASEL